MEEVSHITAEKLVLSLPWEHKHSLPPQRQQGPPKQSSEVEHENLPSLKVRRTLSSEQRPLSDFSALCVEIGSELIERSNEY